MQELLKEIARLENELHETRQAILAEETGLIRLEKKRFACEQQFERHLRSIYFTGRAAVEHTQSKSKKTSHKLEKKLQALKRRTNNPKISKTLLQQQSLHRQLEMLHSSFKKQLKKAVQ